MNKEFLKMQKLAGLITESQMKVMLNETQSFEDFSDVLLDMAIDNNIITSEQSNDSDIIDALFNVWDEMGFERYEETGQGISTSDYNISLAKFSTLIGNQLNENEQPKIGDKVDVFNPKGKYSGWGSDEYLYNAGVVKINGQKITVKDINDDEYEVDLTDVSL
jgi:hypothetical protein